MFKRRTKASKSVSRLRQTPEIVRTEINLSDPPDDPTSQSNNLSKLTVEELQRRYEPQTKTPDPLLETNEQWEYEQLRKTGIEIIHTSNDTDIQKLKSRIKSRIRELEAQLDNI